MPYANPGFLGERPNLLRVISLAMAFAGLNMLIFHFLTYRDVQGWDDDVITPRAARVAGALSLIFWIGVVAFGRWIGFTKGYDFAIPPAVELAFPG